VLLCLLSRNKAIEDIEYTVTDEKNVERKENFKDDREDGLTYKELNHKYLCTHEHEELKCW
jgi:hypothetical protein